MSSFALCVYGGQRAIKYYHDYGDFEFLLLKNEDGTNHIRFASTKPLDQRSIDLVGREATMLLKRTAETFSVTLDNGILTFDDAIKILNSATRANARFQ